MPLILGTNSIKDTGYNVANSCRFDVASTDYLNISQSNGNRKTYTWSCWFKRSTLATFQLLWHCNNAGHYSYFGFDGDDKLIYYAMDGATNQGDFKSTRVFRDVSAWYHLVLACDSSQGTAANRIKIYINGVQESSFSTETYCNQDVDIQLVKGTEVCLGAYNKASPSDFFDGYLAEMVLIDGTQNAVTDFGEFDEDSPTIWKPKDVSGLTFGTNGFYLDFEDSANLGNDANGGTDFTENNLAATDQSTDTCTNNFATWNPLFRKGTTTPAFAEGNLKSTFDDGGANEFALTTFGVSAGKWYAEVKWTSNTGTAATATGILDMAYTGTDDPNNAVTNAFGYFGSGTKNVSGTASSYGNSYADGDIIGIAIDMDNNKLYFSKNGTFQDSGDPTSGSTGTGAISIVSGVTYGIFTSDYNSQVAELNTGSPAYSISSGNADGNGYGNFEYAVPSGYLAICTKNLGSDGG